MWTPDDDIQVNEAYTEYHRILQDPTYSQNPMIFQVTDRVSVSTEKNYILNHE